MAYGALIFDVLVYAVVLVWIQKARNEAGTNIAGPLWWERPIGTGKRPEQLKRDRPVSGPVRAS